MPTVVKLTKIPQLNSIVVKQEGGHFFISTPDSIIIDEKGYIQLTEELVKIGFISTESLKEIVGRQGDL